MSTIPELELIPGTIICLHLPLDSIYPVPDIEAQLLQFAEQRSMSAIVARETEPFPDAFEPTRDRTCVEWLSSAAHISNDEAAAIIGGFRIRVAPRLSQIAGNPRRFLGVAVALARRPDVVVYETAGMDFQRQLLHEYVAERGLEICAVHISYPSVHGTGDPARRICPLSAQCVELSEIT